MAFTFRFGVALVFAFVSLSQNSLPLHVSGASAQSPPVTFAGQIAPLIFDRCGLCHRPGGSAPFSLLTYGEVRQRAMQIAAVTKARAMPPWSARSAYGGFVGQTPLTETEIDLIRRWVEQGAAEGDVANLPPPPRWTEGWQLGEPDAIATLSEPYLLRPDGADLFRVFVIPLSITSVRYVHGLEFQPGNPQVVHHANIRIDRTRASRRFDDEDPLPGYDGLMARSAIYPEGHFLGWTPGQVAPLLRTDLAWPLEEGTDLVVEVHLQPSGKWEAVKPAIGLFFSEDPPRRTPGIMRLGRQNIDIPSGEKNYTITDSFVLPVDVEVQAVQPHAHYRLRELHAEATLPDGTVKLLIQIADWNFRWQHLYRYLTPFHLPKGTTLAMRYTYDNSAENPRNPQQPPKDVSWGQRSFDEMGDLWIQVLTRDNRDLAILNGTFRPKAIAEDVVGLERRIQAEPDDAALRDDVALLYLELGRPNDAVAHVEASARLKPQSAPAHFNLGTVLSTIGRLDEALSHFRIALRINPGYAAARTQLGNALAAHGRLEEASGEYLEALRIDPNDPVAHNNLGEVLLRRGDTDAALTHFREAHRTGPPSAHTYYNLGRAFRRQGESSSAISHLRAALRLNPDWPPALTELAGLLASGPGGRPRDAAEAMRLAERAVDLTIRRDPEMLAVLAAAYAAAGRFDRAIDAAEEALKKAESTSAASSIRERLREYRLRRR